MASSIGNNVLRGGNASFGFVHALLLLGVLAAAAALRFYSLEYRPLHSDEGVNYYFISRVLAEQIYPYSHENYHGPLYFFLSSALVAWLGDSISVLRLLSVCAGICIAASPLLLHRALGPRFVVVAALCASLSPSLVFFSRYAIHEALFACGSALFACGLFLLIRTQRLAWFYFCAALLAVLISIKETFIVLGACLALAAAVELLLSKERASAVRNLISLVRHHFAAALLLFFIILTGIYSSGFVSFAELRELALGVPQWLGRGVSDSGHFKPADYYVQMLLKTEALLLLAPIAALLAFASAYRYLGVRQTGLLYFAVWGIASFAVYSLIPYKTPWLVVNISLPLAFCLALTATHLLSGRRISVLLGTVLLAAHLVFSMYSTVRLNYPLLNTPLARLIPDHAPYGEGNPYSYVHTAPEFSDFLADLDEYWNENPEASVLVACDNYWPIPYYIRERKHLVRFIEAEEYEDYVDEYEVLVLNQGELPEDAAFSHSNYRLSDVQEASVWYRN